MSDDRSENFAASRFVSLLESAAAERAVVEQDLRSLETRSSEPLRDEISSVENELATLKTRQNSALDDLDTLKAAADSLQTQSEQFVKANEEASTRIIDLSAKIIQERSSRLQKLTTFEQDISGIHNALEKIVWTPEALERLAATLRMQLPELEQRSACLDSHRESKRAELDQLQGQSTNCSAEDVAFGPEEQQAILQIFREDISKLQSMLRRLTLQKKHLKEEVDRISRMGS
ncbi:tax1-binding protein 1 homolog [Dermacentor albipictus]|uniref:tax1-binding protein 1 homolog n=1 Tax=Dermacentor albipictus TaxID=60249 RepID=UPI0038FC72BA